MRKQRLEATKLKKSYSVADFANATANATANMTAPLRSLDDVCIYVDIYVCTRRIKSDM